LKHLTQRQIVMLLNGLKIQQDLGHGNNPKLPSSRDFTKYEEANEIAVREINNGRETIYFSEVDELFSQLVENCKELDTSIDGTVDLASLPASGIYH
jgi:hypothetical protein